MALRDDLIPLLDALVATRPASLTLDEIAAAFGTRALAYGDVDAVLDALEREGIEVAAPEPADLPRELGQVLRAARELGATAGRSPGVDEIAAHASLPAAAVRRALLYARVLGR